jgi:hypothetical protein
MVPPPEPASPIATVSRLQPAAPEPAESKPEAELDVASSPMAAPPAEAPAAEAPAAEAAPVAGVPAGAAAPAEEHGEPEQDEQPEPSAGAKAEAPKHRRAAKARTRPVTRQGTKESPHIRADGIATRATSIHFPVEVHQKLRMAAAATERHLSDIVTEAVTTWLRRNA